MSKCIEFGEQYHPEFNGYVSEDGNGVWISTISSRDEGKGNFRKYLKELKSKYEWIKIPTPSARMWAIAKLNGFNIIYEYQKEFNEMMTIMFWKKK